MLRKTSVAALAVLAIAIASCRKSTDKIVPPASTDTTVTLTGTWNLTGIDVTQSTTAIGLPQDSTDSAKINFSDSYPMSTVTGTFVFTGDSLYVNGLSYSAQPQITFSEYTWPGNVLDSTASGLPGVVGLDSTNLGFPYLAVSGKDSISFPQGGIVYPSVGMPLPLTPLGASYAINGDTLKMNMMADTTLSSIGIPGSTGISYFSANSHLVLTLVKK